MFAQYQRSFLTASLTLGSQRSNNNLLMSGLARRFLFIQTQPTPNPSSLKFVPGKPVTGDGSTMDFSNIRYTTVSPLARQLFQVDGVTRVFFANDFISVTKVEDLEWQLVKPEILSVITEHYTRGQPLFTEDMEEENDLTINDDDSEAVQLIKEIIAARVKPFVQEDGGDIKYVSFDEETGLVLIQMKGSCAGCPSSSVTLKNGIENMLKHYVAEVTEVAAVEDEDLDE